MSSLPGLDPEPTNTLRKFESGVMAYYAQLKRATTHITRAIQRVVIISFLAKHAIERELEALAQQMSLLDPDADYRIELIELSGTQFTPVTVDSVVVALKGRLVAARYSPASNLYYQDPNMTTCPHSSRKMRFALASQAQLDR